MRAEIETIVSEIKQCLELLRRHLDPASLEKRLADLEEKAGDQNLWDDAVSAQKILKERSVVEGSLKGFNTLEQALLDHVDLIAMGEEEGDAETVLEAEEALKKLLKQAQKKQLETLLSGEVDANDCYIEINAGAGGTESCDWAEMLLRMYMRWADKRGFKVEHIEATEGEEAGIKSVTLKIEGHNAYGWLKTESGVHRLVRISPFDSNARRHTSFSSVWIYPVLDDSIELEIEDKDLRIDTYRASGAGGQHINKTDSAVRLTHIPTGVVVQCQNSRSQHNNRATAMGMLRSRLYEIEQQKREEEALAASAVKKDIGWGHQIRSYVLHPYQMVKDLRTSVETGNTSAVLDGDIDRFIEAALAAKIG
ncbi:MAG: peptide chain release factor 2 [Alphaproteobacteria bacterium]